MKKLYPFIIIILLIASCKSYNSNQSINNTSQDSLIKNDTVTIGSDENDYEIMIIEPGFNGWLVSTARPRYYYSQEFMEVRNDIYVREWNLRNMQPLQFDPSLYELRIDYDARTDYGYDVNYQLYNYFIYFQLKYKQRLSPAFIPRI